MEEAPKLAWRSPTLSTFRSGVNKKYQELEFFALLFLSMKKSKKANLIL